MQKIRLLLVDDERDFLIAYARRLSRRNVDVSVAGGGREAVEAVKAAPFDAVVLDIMMPGMNGVETLRQLKRVAPDLPVIILTGHVNADVLDQVIGDGAFDYLLKPVGVDELYFKVQDAIRASRFGTA
ncbi:MAG: response regulator [Desulfovibrionaceae bacterium]